MLIILGFSAVKGSLTLCLRGLRGREEQGGEHPGLPVGDRLSLPLHIRWHWEHGQACHAHVNQVTFKEKVDEIYLVLVCKHTLLNVYMEK